MASTSGSWSAGTVAKQHLLQSVAAKALAQSLERDDLVGRDVPKVDARAELLDEPGLGRFRRRLEEEGVDIDVVDDLVHEAGPHLARGTVDPGSPALPALGDDLP